MSLMGFQKSHPSHVICTKCIKSSMGSMGVSLNVFKVILSECCAKLGLGCLVDHVLPVVTYRDPVKGGSCEKKYKIEGD